MELTILEGDNPVDKVDMAILDRVGRLELGV